MTAEPPDPAPLRPDWDFAVRDPHCHNDLPDKTQCGQRRILHNGVWACISCDLYRRWPGQPEQLDPAPGVAA